MKKTSILLSVAVVLVVFTGCIGDAGGSAPAAAVQPPKAAPVVLSLMLNSPELTEQYREMVNAYEAYMPGVEIKMDIRQSDYSTVLKTRLNSGDIPDLFATSAYNDNRLYQSYLYPLTDEPFIQGIEPSMLGGVTENGVITGCPFLVQSHSFIYNKEIFKFANITALPTTLEEYRSACEALAQIRVQPFSTGFDDWWILPQIFYPSMSDVYAGDYPRLFADAQNGVIQMGDLPETDFALDVLDLVSQYGGSDPMASDFDRQCADFAAGRVAMIHQGSWAEQTILGLNPNLQFGYLKAPRLDGRGVLAVDSNLTLRVYKGSPHLNATLAFLNWLITSEYGRRWIPERVKQLSPLKAASVPVTPLALQTSGAMKVNDTCVWWLFAGPDDVEQPLGLALQEYVSGSLSREQVKAAVTAVFAPQAAAQQPAG